jgi:zinc protease
MNFVRGIAPLLAVALAVAASAACHAPRPPAPPRTAPIRYDFVSARLDNGVRVQLLPDRSTDLVFVEVRYEAGSGDDPEGKAGVAHLAEHLTFLARPRGPDAPRLDRFLRAASLHQNAFTTWDSTQYVSLSAKDRLGDVLALEAKRPALCPTVDAAAFEREREVVRNEIRQRSGDASRVVYDLLARAFPKGHASRRPIGGDDEQVAALTLDDVCGFIEDHYVSHRMTITIAGHVDREAALALAREHFGSLPDRAGVARARIDPAGPRTGGTETTVATRLDVVGPVAAVAWPLPPRLTDADLRVRVLLGAFEQEIGELAFEDDRISSYELVIVGAERSPLAVALISVTDAEHLAAAAEAVKTRVAGLGRMRAHDWLRTRRRYQAKRLREFESLLTRASMFGEYAAYGRTGERALVDELRWVADLRSEPTIDAFRRTFSAERAFTLLVTPTDAKARRRHRAALRYSGATHDPEEEPDAEDGGAVEPPPLEVPDRVSPLAAARHFTLPSGLRVVLLPSSTVPVLTARLLFTVGAGHQPAGKAGVAEMAARLLRTGDWSSAYEAQFDLYKSGAELSVSVDLDTTAFTIEGLATWGDHLVRGVEQLVRLGGYRKGDVVKYKSFIGDRLSSATTQQMIAFQRAFLNALYGSLHPYGGRSIPHRSTVGALSADDAVSFHDHYSAANGTLILVGGFDDVLLEKHVRWAFADWEQGRATPPVDAPPAARDEGVHVGVLGSGAGADDETVEIRVAFPIAHPLDDDYAARLVLTAILHQRVSDVRDRLAASYGVTAELREHVAAGHYVIEGSVDADRAGEALVLVRDAVAAVRRGDLGWRFAAARRAVVRTLLADLGDTASLMHALTFLATYDLPPDFFDRLAQRVGRLTTAQVKAVAARELAEANETIVLYGTRASLEAAFTRAGVGSVSYVK